MGVLLWVPVSAYGGSLKNLKDLWARYPCTALTVGGPMDYPRRARRGGPTEQFPGSASGRSARFSVGLEALARLAKLVLGPRQEKRSFHTLFFVSLRGG